MLEKDVSNGNMTPKRRVKVHSRIDYFTHRRGLFEDYFGRRALGHCGYVRWGIRHCFQAAL